MKKLSFKKVKKTIVAAAMAAALVSMNVSVVPGSIVYAVSEAPEEVSENENQIDALDAAGTDNEADTTDKENADKTDETEPAKEAAEGADQDEVTDGEETTDPAPEAVDADNSDDNTKPDEKDGENQPADGDGVNPDGGNGTEGEPDPNKIDVPGESTNPDENPTDQAQSDDEQQQPTEGQQQPADGQQQLTEEQQQPAEGQQQEENPNGGSGSDENAETQPEQGEPTPTDETTTVTEEPAQTAETPEKVEAEEKPVLKLRSMSLAKTYDGKPLTNGDEKLEIEEGWLEGDGADYVFTASQTEIGATFNTFTIVPWEGTSLDDYTLDISYGDLTVMERLDFQDYVLTITGISGTAKYDGTEHTLKGFTLSGRSNYEYQIAAGGDPTETIEFTVGESKFTVTGIASSATGTNAGSYIVDISGSPVVKDEYGHNVTGQFRFEYITGNLTIEKRSITLTSKGDTKEFDGKPLTCSDVEVSGEGFVDGEGAEYKFTGSQTEVGESYNYFVYEMNAGTLESNYDVNMVYGKLKVKEAKKQGGSENQESENTQQEESQSGSPAPTAVKPAGETPSVLGATRIAPTGTDDNKPSVLGARRSATEDMTVYPVLRVVVMLTAFILAAYIITGKKNKIKDNE